MKRILLIGLNGQVSTYLQRTLPDVAELIVANREVLDLAKLDSIGAAIKAAEVDLVINPAAYTAVDAAEEEADLAYLINRDAPLNIAECCSGLGIPLIHFSTDYVFDGTASNPYTEDQSPNPTGVYGASKLAGERAILSTNVDAFILRTSWVYSNHGKNFYKTMLELAENRTELAVVNDQIGSPTYAACIADACTELAKQILVDPSLVSKHTGIYNLTCEGETSWHEFASTIFTHSGLDRMVVNPVPSSEYPTPAKRPAYSVLSGSKLDTTFDIVMPHWKNGLLKCIEESDDVSLL